jgi:hypothetical protein
MDRRLLASLLLASLALTSTACDPDDGDPPADGGTQTDGGTSPADGGTTPADGGTAPTDGGTGGTGAITAPSDSWTWVDFPDSACGNGAATGIGINPTARSTDVFLYLEGGGACWDEVTCFVLGAASNLTTGYGQAQFFSTQPPGPTTRWAVNRGAAENPFKDMSFVYVPYCTGDVHGGDAVRTYGTRPQVHHKGRANMQAFLTRLAATFTGPRRIFLAGSSAGGFGAQLNYERVAQAFPQAEVHLLSDSGQMVTPAGTLLTTWVTNWGLSIPAGCVGCATDFTKFPAYLHDTYPARRFALDAFTQDDVLRRFFGYAPADFETRTLGVLSSAYGTRANAHYFLKAGTSHTMLGSLETVALASGGTSLRSWLSAWVAGSASWTNQSEVTVPPAP